MGEAERAIEKAEEGIERFQALKHSALLANGYLNAGNVYDMLKRYAEAAEMYGKAIELFPTNAMLYRNQASAYMNALDLEKARTALSRAEELQPAHPYLPYRWAELHALQGHGTDSLAATDAALERPGALTQAVWLFRAWALLLLNRQPDALEAINRSIELTTDYHDFLGAIEDTERFQRANPDAADISVILQRLREAYGAGSGST
jgi:tetratricopeptide (TPR) repeat protein